MTALVRPELPQVAVVIELTPVPPEVTLKLVIAPPLTVQVATGAVEYCPVNVIAVVPVVPPLPQDAPQESDTSVPAFIVGDTLPVGGK